MEDEASEPGEFAIYSRLKDSKQQAPDNELPKLHGEPSNPNGCKTPHEHEGRDES
jgi:hypothetical protein